MKPHTSPKKTLDSRLSQLYIELVPSMGHPMALASNTCPWALPWIVMLITDRFQSHLTRALVLNLISESISSYQKQKPVDTRHPDPSKGAT